MAPRIEEELKITRRLSTDGKVHLNLARTYHHVMRPLNELFKLHGLTEPQYNVLRILRGAEPGGLPCQAIGERMIARVPDITRLLDRLEHAGLVGRERSATDRRVVVTRIQPTGMSKLDELDEPLMRLQRNRYRMLTKSEKDELIRILEKMRDE